MEWLQSVDWLAIGRALAVVLVAVIGYLVAVLRYRAQGDSDAAWSVIKELGGAVVALVLSVSRDAVRSVTRDEVAAVAKVIYEHSSFPAGLRNYVDLAQFQAYSWQLWQRFVAGPAGAGNNAGAAVLSIRGRDSALSASAKVASAKVASAKVPGVAPYDNKR